jgi:hypothetical protein
MQLNYDCIFISTLIVILVPSQQLSVLFIVRIFYQMLPACSYVIDNWIFFLKENVIDKVDDFACIEGGVCV